MKFDNTYIALGKPFYQRVLPAKVPKPKLLLWNRALSDDLLITEDLVNDPQQLGEYFSGNVLPEGAEPIALAYSGHQFGHFNPQLGDGRAHLLGEVLSKDNVRFDIQLKGSGQTPFSRRGDGKCALAPALREYIMSEALYALGVPTSRCLAVVSTGETIHRGLAKAGAVVTRVAASHIRVGSFQYLAARGDISSVKALLDYSIERHFPEIDNIQDSSIAATLSQEQRVLAFLEHVIDKQITLIVQWLRIGFIHGVMNTDNTAICGDTIDFGPCAMMGTYNAKTVFSSIDEYGRYAFGEQGKIAHWNMARLADCLLPLLCQYQTVADEASLSLEDKEQAQQQLALAKIETIIHRYPDKFDEAYYTMYASKLGLAEVNKETKALVDELLALMQSNRLDYTQTFYLLTESLTDKDKENALRNVLGAWVDQWLSIVANGQLVAQTVMAKNNPVVIPRNHHVEQILARCEAALESSPTALTAQESINQIVTQFLTVLGSPYAETDATKHYQDTAADGDRYYQTFCGT